MHDKSAFPSEAVLDAFRVRDDFNAGVEVRGHAFLSSRYVLKRVFDVEEAHWINETLQRVESTVEFRIPVPLRTVADGWLADGFICQTRLVGNHDMNRWNEVIDVGAAFHRALAAEPEPVWMSQSDSFNQRCDRFAWDAEDFPVDRRAEGVLARLRGLLKPINERRQLIHGDLTGNVLFESGLAPAIIDLTPYWRPAKYAAGIVVVDAIAVRGASSNGLIADLLRQPNGEQMLLRAALFRGAGYGQKNAYDKYFSGFERFADELVGRIRELGPTLA